MNASEEALVRGWIEQIPYPILAGLYLENNDALAARIAVADLRKRLTEKARLCRRPDLQVFWLEGPPAHKAAQNVDESDWPSVTHPLSNWQKRARIALDQLIHLLPPSPRLDDSVDLWLSARVATTLKRAGLTTLGKVYAAAKGKTWWNAFPGVGPGSGRAVLKLFKSIGLDSSQQALPAEANNSGASFMNTQGDPELDGSMGENRERLRVVSAW